MGVPQASTHSAETWDTDLMVCGYVTIKDPSPIGSHLQSNQKMLWDLWPFNVFKCEDDSVHRSALLPPEAPTCPFRFLDLPFEIREMIIRFYIGPSVEPRVHRSLERKFGHSETLNMNLTLASKEIYTEVMQVLTLRTVFVFRKSHDLGHFMVKYHDLIKKIRLLELSFSSTELPELCGVRCDQITRYHYINYPYEFTCWYEYEIRRYAYGLSAIFISLCRLSPPLRRLRINIPNLNQGRAYDGDSKPRGCQKKYCLALWRGARLDLVYVPLIDFGGYISEELKRSFVEEHARYRKGGVPDGLRYEDWRWKVIDKW